MSTVHESYRIPSSQILTIASDTVDRLDVSKRIVQEEQIYRVQPITARFQLNCWREYVMRIVRTLL